MIRRSVRQVCLLVAAWGLVSSAASAQGWGPKTQAALDKLPAKDRADVSAVLSACHSLTDTHLQIVRQRSSYHPDLDHAAVLDQDGEFWAGTLSQYSLQEMKVSRDIQDLSKRNPDSRQPMEHEAAAAAQAFCLFDRRIAQLEGRSTIAASSAPAPAPAPAVPAAAYGDGAYGPRAKAALDALLAPNATNAKPVAPKVDYSAINDGGPMSDQSKKDLAGARQEFDKTKQRKLHNRENDATDCLKVEPTGVRQEWGMEGRYRIVNTCGYPVEASWCANANECSTGRGNTWKIPPSGRWPIFFADPANPQIGVGGCRTGAQAKPLPSDAAIAAAGGINTSHRQPPPQPGVGVMPNHRCE